MKLNDRKVIEFFSKSPVKSFSAMLDILKFLHDRALPEEVEFEMFDGIRVPGIGGDSAAMVWRFTSHARRFGVVRRRVRRTISPLAKECELIAAYEITPVGNSVLKLLEAIVKTKVIRA